MTNRNFRRPRRGRLGLLTLCVLVWSAPVAAQEVWSVLPFGARGIDPDTAATFRDLLQLALSNERPQAMFVSGTVACGDAACAMQEGRAMGANVVVYGTLNTLGTEIVVAASAVDVPSQQIFSNQRMTVDRPEELDTVADRVARAMTSGTSVEENAQLGSITSAEAEPDIRRRGDNGFILRIGGLVPLADTLGDTNAGIATGIGFWYETTHFAIEPHLGVRFSTNRGDNSFLDVPIEIGAFWIPGLSDVAPFLGGGVGVHFVKESRPAYIVTGNVFQTEMTTVFEDSGWGPSLFGRAGLLLLRTWSTRVSITVDYTVIFRKLNDGHRTLSAPNYPQMFTFGVSVIF